MNIAIKQWPERERPREPCCPSHRTVDPPGVVTEGASAEASQQNDIRSTALCIEHSR